MAYLLGIDQGTTQTTAVVVDEQGQLVAKNSVKLPIYFPHPGYVEQDPWEILDSVRSAVTPLITSFPITAAGFDNQGETFLLWDCTTGQPVTPAIVWQDKRGAAVCNKLAKDVDEGWLRQKTGLLLDSYFTAPKLSYMLSQDGELRSAANAGRLRFGTTESWVLWHLSGGKLHVTDPSTASRTLLFNLNSLEWDAELLSLFDVPSSIFSEVRPTAGYVGDLDFGVGSALPLYGLIVDQQAALFGQACFAPGHMKCTFGTGSFLLMNVGQRPRYSERGLLTTVAWQLAEQTNYALDGGIFVTGAAVQWLVDGLQLFSDVEASADLAEQSLERDVVFVPALAGLAAPYWQPDVRGAMFGLNRATSATDIARATLEGIACRVYEVAKATELDAGHKLARLKVDGGPSGNHYLMQFLADLLDIEIQVAAARESTAIGAANLAGHAALGLTLQELSSRWQAESTYQPNIDGSTRRAHLARWRAAVSAAQYFQQTQHEGALPEQ